MVWNYVIFESNPFLSHLYPFLNSALSSRSSITTFSFWRQTNNIPHKINLIKSCVLHSNYASISYSIVLHFISACNTMLSHNFHCILKIVDFFYFTKFKDCGKISAAIFRCFSIQIYYCWVNFVPEYLSQLFL